MDASGPRLVILTGMSGAGKSTALRCFEDLGYFCIDNLPPTLIDTFLKLYNQAPRSDGGVAVVSDIRSGELFRSFAAAVEQLQAQGVEFELLFIDCEDDELVNRFKATRRRPPLGAELRLEDAVVAERQRMAPLGELATIRIDTSQLTPEQLRQRVLGLFADERDGSPLAVTLLSFGFKHGVPADADFVFDTRFLPNPFYIDELRPLDGNDPRVFDYVMREPDAARFAEQSVSVLRTAFAHYPDVHKSTVLVAVGCTGGKHRSVSIVNYVESLLRKEGLRVNVQHRDLDMP
jgi:UPF0042 nucleotide-binding protein